MSTPLTVRFFGGSEGQWRVIRADTLRGPALPEASHVLVVEGARPVDDPGAWELRGVASHQRYVVRAESEALRRVQAQLGRPEATRAALIPIQKSAQWWSLAQDERRAIFEERSKHIADTLKFLPAIARRLHHSRDLGEPFDFLTWFEFAPEHDSLFEELVAMLRATEEWTYVVREIDFRLVRVR
jgi:hypothetical protein